MSDPDEYFAEMDRRMDVSEEGFDDFVARRAAERYK
jgi:hypothetical protein